jgi:hypothetical protein
MDPWQRAELGAPCSYHLHWRRVQREKQHERLRSDGSKAATPQLVFDRDLAGRLNIGLRGVSSVCRLPVVEKPIN